MSRRVLRLPAAVAAAVMAMTACSAGGAPSSDSTVPDISASTLANGGDRLELVGTSALKWDQTTLTAAAGEVTFVLTSEGAAHNIIIQELDDQLVVEAAPGETQSAAIGMTAGTYTYYCNITGHRAAGMEGVLTVN